MKIYDCFIFNTEIDILRLRLAYLYNTVDYFVLVEAPRTLSNLPKPLHYANNKHLFKAYEDKIIHVVAEQNDMEAWQYEFYQRNCIKNGLVNAADNDLVFISDVDEIINIQHILSLGNYETPRMIEVFMYYYYINLRQQTEWIYNIVAPYSSIKDVDMGIRDQYKNIATTIIYNTSKQNGWHFSYLFGNSLDLYVNKLQSFSHQEFNKPYYLIKNRIKVCIEHGIDLFERPIPLETDDTVAQIMKPLLQELSLSNYLYTPKTLLQISFVDYYWLFRIKIYNRIIAKKNALLKKKSNNH